jgi:hypothetical protein
MTARAAMAPSDLRLVEAGRPVLEIWLRKDVPLRETPSTETSVSFPRIKEGTLVGVVRLTQPWSDFRNTKVKPGVYTLRYGVQPADGNHMGVSDYRDFLILLPLANDNKLDASYTTADLVALHREAVGTAHPPVMGLFPGGEVKEPALSRTDANQTVLSAMVGTVALGLVVEGHAEGL